MKGGEVAVLLLWLLQRQLADTCCVLPQQGGAVNEGMEGEKNTQHRVVATYLNAGDEQVNVSPTECCSSRYFFGVLANAGRKQQGWVE